MDFFKFGLRNILGITLPGGLLVVVLAYISFSILSVFDVYIENFGWIKESTFLIIIIAFILSYIIGSVIRLESADKVDNWSGKYHIWKNRKILKALIINTPLTKNIKKPQKGSLQGNLNSLIKTAKDKLANNKDWQTEINELSKLIYFLDVFPYPLWEFRKFKLSHSPKFFDFFNEYKAPLLAGGKNFFNYSKMVIYSSSLPESLISEVSSAEAFSRFLAGTFFSLIYSIILLIFFSLIHFIFVAHFIFLNVFLISNIFIIAIFLYFAYKIIKGFRNIRLKEVEIVFDAFYLVYRKP